MEEGIEQADMFYIKYIYIINSMRIKEIRERERENEQSTKIPTW